MGALPPLRMAPLKRVKPDDGRTDADADRLHRRDGFTGASNRGWMGRDSSLVMVVHILVRRDRMNCNVRFGNCFLICSTPPCCCLVPHCQDKVGELTRISLLNLLYSSYCLLVCKRAADRAWRFQKGTLKNLESPTNNWQPLFRSVLALLLALSVPSSTTFSEGTIHPTIARV